MAKTTYVWDELSDNVIEEYEDGVLSVSYDHEPGLYGNLLSQNRNGVTSYYHYDGRGDTVALTDDSGNVTDTKEYDAWGNVIASTGSTVTPYQFGGRHGYQTGKTGVYIRARTYQPTIARWCVSRVQQFRFNVFQLNGYAYIISSLRNVQDNSGNDIAPSIDVSLVDPPSSISCARMSSSVTWSYKLEGNGAPCNGFIVQQVTVDCLIDKCTGTNVKSDHYVYYESWKILKGKMSSSQLSGRDKAQWHAGDTFCVKGGYSQATEIRLYCNTDVGLPEGDEKSDIPDWNASKSDNTFYPTATPKGPCSTTSGLLSSSEKAPFWDSVPNRASNVGTRNFTLFFHCCHKKSPCCGDGTKQPTFYYRPPEDKWHKRGGEQND